MCSLGISPVDLSGKSARTCSAVDILVKLTKDCWFSHRFSHRFSHTFTSREHDELQQQLMTY